MQYWGHEPREVEALLVGMPGGPLEWMEVERGSLDSTHSKRVSGRTPIGDRFTMAKDIVHGVRSRR